MNWNKIYKVGFSLFFIVGILLGINALLEGRWAFGLLCIVTFPILLYLILIKNQKTRSKNLNRKFKTEAKPNPPTINIFGILSAIIVIIAFLVASYYCNKAWDYVDQQQKLNCKSCSWSEWKGGTCPYTEEELDEQEYGNDPWCRDMGNYEMLWKFSGMGTMMFMLLALLCLGTLVYNIYKEVRHENRNK